MLTLTIIRGLPGSGKSTMARNIAAETGAVHFEADMFFCLDHRNPPHPLAGIVPEYDLELGDYKFDVNMLATAHQWCQLKTAIALATGYRVVVSNTFVKMWEVEPYMNIADRLNAQVEILTANGRFKNVHGVPDEVLRRMEENWEEIVIPDIME